MSSNYGSDKYKEPERTPEEVERAYCDELARKILDRELDPKNFWLLPRAQ